jgi:phosphoribosylformylglycinamidine synthase
MAYRTPFISGKDSLNNEYRVGDETISIPPTLLISALAMVPDVRRAVTMDAKRAGDVLYLVGLTRAELGGSSWHRELGLEGGRVPRPDLGTAPALLAALHAAIAEGLVRACHDLSEGGLAVAVAELSFAGGLGVDLDLARVPCDELAGGYDPDATRLFSESCTRFLVEVDPADAETFESALAGHACAAVGAVVSAPRLQVVGTGGAPLCEVSLGDLRAAHEGGFSG